MSHLNDHEFVDWLDGRLPSARVRHAEQCETCRAKADELAATLAAAAGDPPHEPSPLFWDLFSARVSEAVRQEPPPAPAPPLWLEWLRHPVSIWAGAAVAAILMISTVAWRATLHAPSSPAIVMNRAIEPPPPPAIVPAPDAVDDLDQDEAWAVVRSAAEGFGWEDATAAGISVRPGSAERVALEMSAEERAALVRLIEDEIRRNGA
jgi:hypothetical protein